MHGWTMNTKCIYICTNIYIYIYVCACMSGHDMATITQLFLSRANPREKNLEYGNELRKGMEGFVEGPIAGWVTEGRKAPTEALRIF